MLLLLMRFPLNISTQMCTSSIHIKRFLFLCFALFFSLSLSPGCSGFSDHLRLFLLFLIRRFQSAKPKNIRLRIVCVYHLFLRFFPSLFLLFAYRTGIIAMWASVPLHSFQFEKLLQWSPSRYDDAIFLDFILILYWRRRMYALCVRGIKDVNGSFLFSLHLLQTFRKI